MKHLFSIGEIAKLESIGSPDCNGDREVINVIYPNQGYQCQECGKEHPIRESDSIGYQLRGLCCRTWKERALRKKHEVSKTGFIEMLGFFKEMKLAGER